MKQKWSKEVIIGIIKDLKNQNIDLSAGYVSKNYVSLFTAASSSRYFNSWANAVRESGINYDQILDEGKSRRRSKLTKWSKTQVLEEVKKSQSLNLLTTYRDRLALYSAARREFGSWKEALEQAGYKLTKGSNKNSNQIVEGGKLLPESENVLSQKSSNQNKT
jgi:hypothetical protein